MLPHENYDCWARERGKDESFEELEGQKKG